ncbi:hypothetical protein BC938DRAFT_482719 [Jimgerdemannia flammicorona]|uniref:Uncharacterized protein n=1 Tax=Jimgerdemannia flammicorona TaxID=994334 RepID=A0A433QDH0_9FUNG|nr:hypothetical protein BC938DRAFT_482719 [Jimgerdemannia flammicorona]
MRTVENNGKPDRSGLYESLRTVKANKRGETQETTVQTWKKATLFHLELYSPKNPWEARLQGHSPNLQCTHFRTPSSSLDMLSPSPSPRASSSR